MAKEKLPEGDKKDTGAATTVTGDQLLILIIFFPIVMVWLLLGGRIIWSATSDPATLDRIEGLLTGLAIMTLPVTLGLQEIFKRYSAGGRRKDKD